MTVMIGIDPHKGSHTAVALGEADQVLDQICVVADGRQLERLLGWAQRWPDCIGGQSDHRPMTG